MSTKKTQEALSAMRSCIKSGEPWASDMAAVHAEALAELEAIRQAAKVLTECDMDLFPRGTLTPEDAQGAMDVLLAIAKEAP